MIIKGTEKWLHKASACGGAACPIHHPSGHAMASWPMNLRLDYWANPLIERTCPHGVGHPDPDSVAFLLRADKRRSDWGVHGCDGCCGADDDNADAPPDGDGGSLIARMLD